MKRKALWVATAFILLLLAFSVDNLAHAVAVTAIINVQQEPTGVAYDSAKGEIFVVNTNAGTVSVISDTNNTVTATIPLGNPVPIGVATWVAYDSGKGELFVSLSGTDGEVVVISDSDNTVVDKIVVGGEPEGLAYDSAKGEIFVANALSDNISVISDETNSEIANVTVPSGTLAIACDSGNGEIYATDLPPNNRSNPNASSNTVSVISDSENLVITNIEVESNPQGIVYDSGKGEVFVTNLSSETVSIISDKTNKVTTTVSIGEYPSSIAYDSEQGELFIGCSNATGLANPFTTALSVSVLPDNSNTVSASIAAGDSGIAYDSSKGEIFVANALTGTVYVLADTSDASTSPSQTMPEYNAHALIFVMFALLTLAIFANLFKKNCKSILN